MILLGSYVCYITNTLDTLEAFIAETMYNLSLPNLGATLLVAVCNCSLLGSPGEIATRVDVSWNGIFWDRSRFRKINSVLYFVLQKRFNFFNYR